jgi:antirestriction protein ArdC
MAKVKRDIYQEITNQMIAQLEAGTPPWTRPWKNGKATFDMPHNGESGRAYSGINQLILWCSNYVDTRWLTFNQIRNLGGSNKGQKATTVTVWKTFKGEDKNGKEKSIPFCRAHSIWNMEQLTGIDKDKLYPAPEATEEKATTGTDLAEQVGAKLLPYGGNKAYYVPSQDAIRLPTQEQFIGDNSFDAVMFHELTHWTAHKSRKDRDLTGRFGDDRYAAEELIAEIGSAFLCARFGVELSGLQHASYVDHWLKIMKGDKKAIFTAASQARQAVEFMVGTEEEKN